MPRVTLTKQQKIDAQIADHCKQLLTSLNAAQGARRLDDVDFGPLIGVHPRTWHNWHGTKSKPAAIGRASLEDVLKALYLTGHTVKIEVIA